MNFEYDESSDEVIVDFGCGTRRVECYVNANQLAALERLRTENERLENALIAILNAMAPTPVLTYQLMERIAQAALRGEGEK